MYSQLMKNVMLTSLAMITVAIAVSVVVSIVRNIKNRRF